MKPIPAPPLILIPAQLRFRFLMILFHPVAPVRILNQHGQGGVGWEVTPEIFPVPLLALSGTLPDQPADVAGPIAIDPPAAQGENLRPPPPLGPLTPREAAPRLPGLCVQPLIAPADRAVVAPSQDHTASGPHRPPVALLALR
jgi:hypothetical protein